jgi:type I restriction enzyme R subunit
MTILSESVVEQARLAWIESVGWSVRHGAEIALGDRPARRGFADYSRH